MSFVKEIPAGLRYSVVEVDNVQISTLDMRKTAIFVVPAKLQGVDRILVNNHQLRYVSPDFKGQIYICGGLNGRPSSATPEELDQWHNAYSLADSTFFERSCLNSKNEEQMLIKGLIFDRKHRRLNARNTTLLEVPSIEGVVKVKMPSKDWAKMTLRIKKHKNYLHKKAGKIADNRYISQICHRKKVSNTNPDYYV